jgi:uncharacterized membrane protein
MLRRLLTPPATSAPSDPWRLRGHTPGRLENFSDCTFAFALTLLAISVEVPKTYDDLIRILPGFFSFAACFAILCMLWQRHVIFFRRYGLNDSTTVALNTALLGLMLFYIYPMKFLMNSAVDAMRIAYFKIAGAPTGGVSGPANLIAHVLPIYLIGFAAVALAFALLFRHALRRRQDLKLSLFEESVTRDDMILWAVSMVCALVTAAWYRWAPHDLSPYGSFVLFIIPLMRRIQRRRQRRGSPAAA